MPADNACSDVNPSSSIVASREALMIGPVMVRSVSAMPTRGHLSLTIRFRSCVSVTVKVVMYFVNDASSSGRSVNCDTISS